MTISGQSMQSHPYSPALQYWIAGINPKYKCCWLYVGFVPENVFLTKLDPTKDTRPPEFDFAPPSGHKYPWKKL